MIVLASMAHVAEAFKNSIQYLIAVENTPFMYMYVKIYVSFFWSTKDFVLYPFTA